eukprot:2339502-Alexandrium_andersonii.AAC.1
MPRNTCCVQYAWTSVALVRMTPSSGACTPAFLSATCASGRKCMRMCEREGVCANIHQHMRVCLHACANQGVCASACD